jgi:hypothetical protein
LNLPRALIISWFIPLVSVLDAAGQSFSTSEPAAPTASAAQEPGNKLTRLMLGVNIKQTIPTGTGTANRFGVDLGWRWRSRNPSTEDRFALAYRLGSYSTSVSGPVLGERMEIGDVRLRPLLVGVDYKMPRGRWNWSVGATGGLSFNSLDTASTFRDRLIRQTGADVVTDIHNSFAFSLRVKGWYDINRRMSLLVETAYTFSRPELTIRTSAGDLSRTLNADAVVFKTGLVYGIW